MVANLGNQKLWQRLATSYPASLRPRDCGRNNLIALRSCHLLCAIKIALHGTIKAVIEVFFCPNWRLVIVFAVALHLAKVNSILSLTLAMLNSISIVIAILSWTTPSALDVIPLNPKNICRTWCHKRWLDSFCSMILQGCVQPVSAVAMNVTQKYANQSLALGMISSDLLGPWQCDSLSVQKFPARFSHETKKCLRSRRWVIVHLMISSFSSRANIFSRSTWKWSESIFAILMWLEKVFFLFADTSTANIPSSKSFHKFNHRSQMDFNSKWITRSKLWRCQHSSMASFLRATRRSSFCAFVAALLLSGVCNFRFERREKKKEVCAERSLHWS